MDRTPRRHPRKENCGHCGYSYRPCSQGPVLQAGQPLLSVVVSAPLGSLLLIRYYVSVVIVTRMGRLQ